MSDAALPESGAVLDRRKVLAGLLLAAGAGVSFARQPSNTIDFVGDRKLEKIVPNRIGSWEFVGSSGLVVPTEDTLSDALYSQLLTRVYTDGANPPIMLLIAQGAGQTGLLQIHRPEFCYPAGGYALTPIVQRPIDAGGQAILVNKLTATIPGRTEQIIYWTRVGNRMPVSWVQQRLAIAADNLRGYIPDAVLVRVSTIDQDEAAAFPRLLAFVEAMLGSLGPNRNILVSRA